MVGAKMEKVYAMKLRKLKWTRPLPAFVPNQINFLHLDTKYSIYPFSTTNMSQNTIHFDLKAPEETHFIGLKAVFFTPCMMP